MHLLIDFLKTGLRIFENISIPVPIDCRHYLKWGAFVICHLEFAASPGPVQIINSRCPLE